MSWIKILEKFDKKGYKPDNEQWYYFLNNRFNIHIELKANRLYKGYFKIIRNYESAKKDENNNGNRDFSENNYMVLFPEYGLKINCTKDFIENIPLLENAFSGKWQEKTYRTHYYDKKIKKKLKGPQIYVSNCSLDMYIYKNDHENAQNKQNLLESILSISRDFY